MRILMISDVYFPRINGVSTSTQIFRHELIRLGHDVTLIAPGYGNEEPEDDIIRIPSRTVPRDPEDRMMKRSEIRRRFAELRQMNFDLIHIQTPFIAHYVGVELARYLQIPVVESYHTFFEEYLYHYVPYVPKSWMRLLARRFTRSQCNAVDAVVVPSTAMQEVLHRYGVTTPMHIIPTGMELDKFDGGDGKRFRDQHGISAQRPVLVNIGRVAHEKNIGFLLQMLDVLRREVPDVLLVIAGEGPARTSLQHMAQTMQLQDNVLFVGYLDRNSTLLDCYCAGDVFVFASRTETQGLVLLESMTLGVPVVSTAVMGTRDILQARRGGLIAVEDTDLFASTVKQVLTEPLLKKRLQIEAKNYVQEWSATAMARKMAGLYEYLTAPLQTVTTSDDFAETHKKVSQS